MAKKGYERNLSRRDLAILDFVARYRVGTEGNIEFWGNSLLVDPYGETIANGSSDQAQIIQGDADFSLIDVARTHWPFLRDRRIDAYQGLDQRLLDQADK